jgi:IPT/TIG domain
MGSARWVGRGSRVLAVLTVTAVLALGGTQPINLLTPALVAAAETLPSTALAGTVADNATSHIATLSPTAALPADRHRRVVAPTVTGVSPTSGPTTGGTSVTISGSNLSAATLVSFGSTAGTITSNTATQVVATSPAGSGVVDITVKTAGGTSATSSADRFTYVVASTPATITAVGTLYTHTNQPSLSTETISVSPAAAGNVLALAIETKFPSGVPSFTASGVSGGGVTTWKKARSSLTIDGIHEQELWWGVVTTSGPSTITVSYTSGSTSGNAESATALDVQEFRSSSGTSTVWSLDVTGVVDTGVPTTVPNYPTLTPTSTNEAYFGYLAVPGFVSAGSTPGVVYQVDARGNQCAYAQSVSSMITPVASGSSQTFFSIGMLLKAV